jgi:short-subunit dehydrogenase
MSIAHRFGREGHDVALISRTDARHAGYLAELGQAGVKAEAFTADVRDHDRLRSVLERIGGEVEVLYYGPGAVDQEAPVKPITEVTAADTERAMTWTYPAIEATRHVLPGMLGRGRGALLFAGGLSSVVPMPGLGALAINAAALRNYAVTLNAALAEQGVYAGTLTIGGLVERGDIHRMLTADPGRYGHIPTLNPDDIADTAWRLCVERDRAEAVFNVLG